MSKPKDDWEKTRTHGQHLTEADVASLKASYRANRSSREAARTIRCSSRIASKYYGFFKAEGVGKNKPTLLTIPASRFYCSNFELEGE